MVADMGNEQMEWVIQLSAMNDKVLQIARYSLVICRAHNKYLCVQQGNGKWWIPGGAVQKYETHGQAAIREAKEEADIDITLKGLLAIDTVNFQHPAIRIIYYAQPTYPHQLPKNIPDKQSKKASFLTLEEIAGLRSEWRALEIYHYPKYLEQGGEVFPLSVLQESELLYN